MYNVIGIDPGLDGAIVLISQDGVALCAHDMPTKRLPGGPGKRQGKRVVDALALAEILSSLDSSVVWIEDVFSSPQMGVVSSFSFGASKGVLSGACASQGKEVFFVRPVVWKSQLGCTSNKKQTVARAKYFSKDSPLLTRVDISEAFMVALFGLLSR